MAEKDSDPLTEMAKEIVRQLPVKQFYEDALQRPSQQVGIFLTDALKTIRLALAPVQITATLQDRFSGFIKRARERVPEENQIVPPPQILGPVLEGIRYEPEDQTIDQMFSQLLSRAMNRERIGEAHPAFPHLIRELSPDEAVLLTIFRKQKQIDMRLFQLSLFPNEEEIKSRWEHISRMGIQHSRMFLFYLDHLSSMGLIAQDKPSAFPVNKSAGTRPSWYVEPPASAEAVVYVLTRVGEVFVEACLPE